MHVHVVGIGGAGMSAIARLLRARMTVSGSDRGRWPLSEALVPAGVRVYDDFASEHIDDADVVLRSSAYNEANNVEVRAARERGKPLWTRDDAWRVLAEGQRVVAVAGTHGKTTTTAMAWSALRGAGRDPSLVCGAAVAGLGANAHVGSDPLLVIEADEYDHAFLALDPDVAVVLNVDHDHVDLFPTREEYAEAFRRFAGNVRPGGTLVACADDEGSAALAAWAHEALPGRTVVTYGRRAGATFRVEENGLRLRVPGAHNAANAVAAVAAAAALGLDVRGARAGVEAFAGTERRLEDLGAAGGVTVVDDYAHHPVEIRASIEAMRGRGERLIAVFQPHTPSRLAAFAEEFAAALREADLAFVVETFSSAREQPAAGARDLAERAGGRYARNNDEAAGMLADVVRPGDLVLILGAGDVRAAGTTLLELLRKAPA